MKFRLETKNCGGSEKKATCWNRKKKSRQNEPGTQSTTHAQTEGHFKTSERGRRATTQVQTKNGPKRARYAKYSRRARKTTHDTRTDRRQVRNDPETQNAQLTSAQNGPRHTCRQKDRSNETQSTANERAKRPTTHVQTEDSPKRNPTRTVQQTSAGATAHRQEMAKNEPERQNTATSAESGPRHTYRQKTAQNTARKRTENAKYSGQARKTSHNAGRDRKRPKNDPKSKVQRTSAETSHNRLETGNGPKRAWCAKRKAAGRSVEQGRNGSLCGEAKRGQAIEFLLLRGVRGAQPPETKPRAGLLFLGRKNAGAHAFSVLCSGLSHLHDELLTQKVARAVKLRA